jgi:CheY-like chemotaxis protein
MHSPLDMQHTASTGAATGTGSTAELPLAWARLRVLVVDDETVNRRVLRTWCRGLGVGVVDEAADGDEVAGLVAAAAAAGAPYHVVLMDIVMKRMHGTEAARALREAAARGDGPPPPPIVCVSANTALLQAGGDGGGGGGGAMVGAGPAGLVGGAGSPRALFDALLPKPFTKAGLREVLQQVVGEASA